MEESLAMVEPDKRGVIGLGSSLSERARMAASAIVAVVVAVPVALISPWQLSVLVGWDLAAIVFIGWTWARGGPARRRGDPHPRAT